MAVDVPAEVEVAIRDTATLLLRLEKYRRGREDDIEGDRVLLAGLGARARRAARDRDDEELLAIRDAVAAVGRRATGTIESIVRSAQYRLAVAAHRNQDATTLEPLLLDIFADLERAPTSGEVFAPVAWSARRGPKSPEEVTAVFEGLREGGLNADGDSLDPGVDPDLPAVGFRFAWPDGAPVAVACRLEELPQPALIGAAGEIFVHRRVVKTPFTIVFQLDRSLVDEWIEDPNAYRTALVPRLRARGFTTRTVPVPAAP